MGLSATVSVYDFGYESSTETLHIPIDYSEGCEVFAETFYDIATSLVPVDTGNLMNSIGYDLSDTTIFCYAMAEYAQYVEFGTIYMSAQPYFIPALEEAYDIACDYWDMALDEAYAEEEELLAEMEEEEKEDDEEMMSFGFNVGGFLGLVIGMFIAASIKELFNQLSYTPPRGAGSFPKSIGRKGFVSALGGDIDIDIF